MPAPDSDQFVTDLLRALRGDFRSVACSLHRRDAPDDHTLGCAVSRSRGCLSSFVSWAPPRSALDFVAVFADPASLASTRAAWHDLQAQLRVAYDLPWSHAVLRALELSDYRRLPRHEPGFVARRSGISLRIEIDVLAALAAAHQIRR